MPSSGTVINVTLGGSSATLKSRMNSSVSPSASAISSRMLYAPSARTNSTAAMASELRLNVSRYPPGPVIVQAHSMTPSYESVAMNENGNPSPGTSSERTSVASGPMSMTVTSETHRVWLPSSSVTRTAIVYTSESPSAPNTLLVELPNVTTSDTNSPPSYEKFHS